MKREGEGIIIPLVPRHSQPLKAMTSKLPIGKLALRAGMFHCLGHRKMRDADFDGDDGLTVDCDLVHMHGSTLVYPMAPENTVIDRSTR